MPTRVLVTDDSSVARRLIANAIERDRENKVVAFAKDGHEALELIERERPDVMTLDIEMPGMDGVQTLVEVRRRHPRLPVIMISSLTEQGARITLEALAKGANDYVTKPTADLGGASIEWLAGELGPRIRGVTGGKAAHAAGGAVERGGGVNGAPVRLLVIGASTGGPDAIARVLPALPHPLPIPTVIVQHMPSFFTRVFAERLAATTRADVREAQDRAVLQPGTIRVAPGERHLAIRSEAMGLACSLTQDPPENYCRPAVDVTLRTAAEACGGRVLAVILTGIGSDGKAGCGKIAQMGGQVIAQDEKTSVVWGMPGAVARAGYANRILPLADIATEITRRLPARINAQPRLAVSR